MILTANEVANATASSVWHRLADDVLAGRPINNEQAESILRSSDVELLDLVAAAYRLRHVISATRCSSTFCQCQERPVPRGLFILFAIEDLQSSD